MNAPQTDLTPQSKIPFADALRGIAAFSVVLAHVFGLFWLDRTTIAQLTRLPALTPDFATPTIAWLGAPPGVSLGAAGVAIFFLVSGFVIPFSIERYSRGGFVVGRLFRIAPTYVVGFLSGVAALFYSSQSLGEQFGYSLSEIARHIFPGLRQFLSAPSIDGVVWTLEVEICFYAVCIIFARGIRIGSLWTFLAAGVLAVCCACHWLWVTFPVGEPLRWYIKPLATPILILAWASPFIVFMLVGAVFNFWFRKKIGDAAAIVIGVILLGLAAAMYFLVNENPAVIVVVSYAVGLAVFLMAYVLRDVIAENSALQFLSSISYPLYVVHPLFAYSTLNVLVRSGVDSWIATLCIAMATIVLAWALHIVVEQPSHRLGQKIARAGGFRERLAALADNLWKT